MNKIKRRKTPTVQIGNILLGSGYPIVIQSMTDTPTANTKKTIVQIKELADAGSELVRITINDEKAMQSVPEIINKLKSQGYETPIIGDFHYNGHTLLSKYPENAKLLAKYRINPGNIGGGNKKDDNFQTIIKIAIANNKPVRIGVNWGSLDQNLFTKLMDINSKLTKPKSYKQVLYQAMVKSAIDNAKYAQNLGLKKEKIVLSVKMSEVQDMINVYALLAKKCDYALHLGLTEAGAGVKGIAASSAALGILMQKGIGDTIRISLTPEPGKPRTLEVENCKVLLQILGLRYFRPTVTSCPGCGRTSSDVYQRLAADINKYIDKNLISWQQKYPGIEKLHIAVMGCVVNGPGESKHADIGISLPGINETAKAPVYINGKKFKVLKGNNLKDQFLVILDEYFRKYFS